MARYVCGFMMTDTEVILIEKTHPRWQEGKWNGIGGRIKHEEPPIVAMHREWEEETGDKTQHDWVEFVRYKFPKAIVYCFVCRVEKLPEVMKTTDEFVDAFTLANLPSDLVDHVDWLVRIAHVSHHMERPVIMKGL